MDSDTASPPPFFQVTNSYHFKTGFEKLMGQAKFTLKGNYFLKIDCVPELGALLQVPVRLGIAVAHICGMVKTNIPWSSSL